MLSIKLNLEATLSLYTRKKEKIKFFNYFIIGKMDLKTSFKNLKAFFITPHRFPQIA